MIFQAVQKAALKSHIGGYIYVTMDGLPGDYHLEPWVANTIRRRKLTFKLTLAKDYDVEVEHGQRGARTQGHRYVGFMVSDSDDKLKF